MSRVTRFIHNAWSSSALIILSAVYGLASLPLAVHFLSTKEIGLWMASTAIADSLTMIDMGTTTSMARLLVDYKDQRTPEGYGSLLKTGMVVLAVQGVIILLVGSGLSFFTGALLKASESLASEARWLMFGLACATAASFATRVFGQVLTAHQRSDITSYGQMISLGLGFVVLWVSFACGLGVFSLLVVRVVTWLFQSSYCYAACRRLDLWPRAHEWGKVSREKFRALFKYGLDVFLIGLGTQLVSSSQYIVVSHFMGGLDAAAIWGAMTKAWTLVQQLLWRAVAVSMTGFAEMQVQGQVRRMWERYRVFFSTITALGGLFSVMAAIGNGPFVALWMHGKFSWSVENDWLYGAFLIVAAQAGIHNYIVMFLKDIRRQKYVYFAEGLLFLLLGAVFVPRGGFPAMIGCSIVSCLLCTLGYGAYRVAEMQNISMAQIFTGWQKPLATMLAAVVPPAILLVYLTRHLSTLEFLLRCGVTTRRAPAISAVLSPTLQLLLRCGPVGLIGVYVLFKKCLPADLVGRIQGFMPKALRAYC